MTDDDQVLTNVTSKVLTNLHIDDEVRAICEACDRDPRNVEKITIHLVAQPSSVNHLVEAKLIVWAVEIEMFEP